jgi:hypothetical protein
LSGIQSQKEGKADTQKEKDALNLKTNPPLPARAKMRMADSKTRLYGVQLLEFFSLYLWGSNLANSL